ncbi:MAG: cell division protein ZapA [Selenomonas ruminantium]|jgi:cell division protein ZapA|uniref:Cell division protein ZapA n=1 Tax=Selenomonas ruminantium TaxID=971 RepID=A0A927WJB2_SELRU|nr:cell division protein ZapA [Selenomonas ruminantium]MBE6084187.1 cell division protein ZapA [Selenomonas ruminantium]
MAEEKNNRPAERVVVEIYGNSYPLKTDDPQHMKMLAAVVDKKMKAMSRSVRSFDERKIAVLTTLQIAEEYYKLKKDYDELVDLLDEK